MCDGATDEAFDIPKAAASCGPPLDLALLAPRLSLSVPLGVGLVPASPPFKDFPRSAPPCTGTVVLVRAGETRRGRRMGPSEDPYACK